MLVNLTAMEEARFTIADCLQFKIFKVEKLLWDVVFTTTGFLNLWPYTCLFHIPWFPVETCTLQTFACTGLYTTVKFSLKNAMLHMVLVVRMQMQELRCCVILSD